MNKYNVVNGTAYNENTSIDVINVLENALKTRQRLQLFFGDIETGKNWNEENDTIGKIGRSCGNYKVPLLIKTSRSYGGGAILDNCIIKIRDMQTKKVLFQNPKFQQSKFEIKQSDGSAKILGYNFSLYIDGNLYSNHKTELSAKRLLNKLS